MNNMRRVLILCLLATTKSANAQENKFVKAGQATEEDVKLLSAITSEEALPFISFATPESTELQILFGLTEVAINNGRLVSGTTFFTSPPAPQMFFCPNSQSSQKCLAPKRFEASEILKCDLEPMPILQAYPKNIVCGSPADNGVLLMFTYEVCPAELPYRYNTQHPRIYFICYDEKAKKNLFVSYSMIAAALLSEDLLIREREIEFPMNTESYGWIDENYYATLQAEIQQNPNYDLQTLVPIEDMPLATSRKTTRYYANYAPQHKNLIGLWNEIRNHIRAHAALISKDQIIAFMTGVFDVPENEISVPIGEGQMPTVWVTQMKTMLGDRTKGLVIVMNNFISENPINRSRDEGNLQQQYIDKLCEGENLCVHSLKQKFNEVGGKVRCCRLTKNILNLFFGRIQFSEHNAAVLHISNVA